MKAPVEVRPALEKAKPTKSRLYRVTLWHHTANWQRQWYSGDGQIGMLQKKKKKLASRVGDGSCSKVKKNLEENVTDPK